MLRMLERECENADESEGGGEGNFKEKFFEFEFLKCRARACKLNAVLQFLIHVVVVKLIALENSVVANDFSIR